jgi:hypothetical protein
MEMLVGINLSVTYSCLSLLLSMVKKDVALETEFFKYSSLWNKKDGYQKW